MCSDSKSVGVVGPTVSIFIVPDSTTNFTWFGVLRILANKDSDIKGLAMQYKEYRLRPSGHGVVLYYLLERSVAECIPVWGKFFGYW